MQGPSYSTLFKVRMTDMKQTTTNTGVLHCVQDDDFETMLMLVGPGAEETAEDDEFAEMVGVEVGDEKGFAEEVLAVAPAEGFEEVGLRIFDERDEGFEIGVNDLDGAGPGVGGGGVGGVRPVVLGAAQGGVAAGGWRGKVQDVAQGDAEVFEKLPGGVGQVRRDGAAEAGGEILDDIIEGGVCLAATKEIDQ